MYKGPLIHSLLCSEFVELTLILLSTCFICLCSPMRTKIALFSEVPMFFFPLFFLSVRHLAHPPSILAGILFRVTLITIVKIARALKVSNSQLIPQFRSIIPCEVLLYIEVTFWDLSIDMGIFRGSWFLHNHEIHHPNQWGKYEKPQRNDVNSTVRSDILVFNCYLCHVRFLLTCYVCSTKIGENSDI